MTLAGYHLSHNGIMAAMIANVVPLIESIFRRRWGGLGVDLGRPAAPLIIFRISENSPYTSVRFRWRNAVFWSEFQAVFRPAVTSILHARAVEGGLRFYPAVHFADVATTARASACAKHGRQWFCACFLGLVADPGVTYRASSRRASLRNSGSRRHSVLGRSNLRGSIFAGLACPRVQPVNTVCSGFNSAVSQGRLAAARPKYLQ